MTEIADQVSHKVDNDYMINQTLRNYKSLNPESVLSGVDFDKALDISSRIGGTGISDVPVYNDFPPTNTMESVKIAPAKQPQWGCMKGGSLPTYRVWSNQTQKAREPMQNQSDSIARPMVKPSVVSTPQINLGNMSMSSISSIGGQPTAPKDPEPPKSLFDAPRLSQLKQTMEKIKTSNEAQEKSTIKYGKRKKTIRRTYKLGKSRVTPKVSVLVSNKTVRKNISTKTEKLKQIPIDEIRAVLIKKGFIKVGSVATNDVLRKMYESMLLVCGEVENHNPENMLYNYLHA
jgi:hypothetical protein